jgi:hypothetical protein
MLCAVRPGHLVQPSVNPHTKILRFPAARITLLVAGAVPVGAQPASVSIVADNQYGVGFVNNDGRWTIWKNCFEYRDGPRPSPSAPVT